MKSIQVVLAEDHHVVRAAVADFLEKEPDITIIGQIAEGGPPLLRLVKQLQPDVLVLDAHMPNHKVVESAKQLRSCCPNVNILVLSAYSRREYVEGVLNVGAVGYVLKDDSPETLTHAVRAAARGERWVSPKAMAVLFNSGNRGQSHSGNLTSRELEVLKLMAVGHRNDQIAEDLYISQQTVKNHVRHIFSKLGVETRVEAVLYAINNGIVARD